VLPAIVEYRTTIPCSRSDIERNSSATALNANSLYIDCDLNLVSDKNSSCF